MKVKVNAKQILAVAVILNILFMLQSIPVTANPVSPTLYLDDLPMIATYIVKTDGTNYWAIRYDGYKAYDSTNASYVFTSVLAGGGLIFVRAGTYDLGTYHIDAPDTKSWQLVGEGRNITQILFDGSTGLHLTAYASTSAVIMHLIQDISFIQANSGATAPVALDLNGYHRTTLNRVTVTGQSSPVSSSIGVRLRGDTDNSGAGSEWQSVSITYFSTDLDVYTHLDGSAGGGISHYDFGDLSIYEFTKYGVKILGYDNVFRHLKFGTNVAGITSAIGFYSYNNANPNNVINNAFPWITSNWFSDATNFLFHSDYGTLQIDNLLIEHSITFHQADRIKFFKEDANGNYHIGTWFADRTPPYEGSMTAPIALSTTSNNLAGFNSGNATLATEAMVKATITSGSYTEGQSVLFYGYHILLRDAAPHTVSINVESLNSTYTTIYAYDDSFSSLGRNNVDFQYRVTVMFVANQTLATNTILTMRVTIH